MSLIEKHFPTAENTRRVRIDDDFDLFAEYNRSAVNRMKRKRKGGRLFHIKF